jgi:hypothetical protein
MAEFLEENEEEFLPATKSNDNIKNLLKIILFAHLVLIGLAIATFMDQRNCSAVGDVVDSSTSNHEPFRKTPPNSDVRMTSADDNIDIAKEATLPVPAIPADDQLEAATPGVRKNNKADNIYDIDPWEKEYPEDKLHHQFVYDQDDHVEGRPKLRGDCIRMSDGTETCRFEDLCFDPSTMQFELADAQMEANLLYQGHHLDWRFEEPAWFSQQPIEAHAWPLGQKKIAQSVSLTEFQNLRSLNSTRNLQSAYFVFLEPDLQGDGNNLFHFSSSILMLLDPQVLSST